MGSGKRAKSAGVNNQKRRCAMSRPMICVCNNRACINNNTPCFAGYINNGVADNWSKNAKYSPWFPEYELVKVIVVYCKGGRQ